MLEIAIFLMLLLFPKDAYAYIDPGVGSYIFQILIAVLLGTLFYLKFFLRRVRNFIRRLTGRGRRKDKDE